MRARLTLLAIIAAIAGLAGFYVYFWGQGEVHLLVSPEEKAIVRVDGKPVKPERIEGRHQRYDLPRGVHTVAVEREGSPPREAKLDIKSGFTSLMMPVADDQCFARLDVSKAMYSGASSKALPTIVRRYSGKEPFDIEGSTYLTEKELPNRKKASHSVYLMVDYNCEDANLPDGQLLQELWQ